MAEELKVTAVYLSSVENGKRNIPKHWGSEITRIYELDEEQSQLLLEAIWLKTFVSDDEEKETICSISPYFCTVIEGCVLSKSIKVFTVMFLGQSYLDGCRLSKR